tara:strand:+ start:858 stop:1217 length:360 start_codon:yes stop_codon:yes gene_type:complete
MSFKAARLWTSSYNAAVERLHERCRRGEVDGMHLDWSAGGLVMDSAIPSSCLVFARPGGGQTIGYIMPRGRFKLLGKVPRGGYQPFDLDALGVRWAGWRAPKNRWTGVEPMPTECEEFA